jgi:hypothetical protein
VFSVERVLVSFEVVEEVDFVVVDLVLVVFLVEKDKWG